MLKILLLSSVDQQDCILHCIVIIISGWACLLSKHSGTCYSYIKLLQSVLLLSISLFKYGTLYSLWIYLKVKLNLTTVSTGDYTWDLLDHLETDLTNLVVYKIHLSIHIQPFWKMYTFKRHSVILTTSFCNIYQQLVDILKKCVQT